jgi:glycosyltransferase involved in cell wall biosynthesis
MRLSVASIGRLRHTVRSNTEQSSRRSLRVSVAMATYNGERFVLEQLRSLASQTRLPDELVVSDDGSEDRTLQIVRDSAAEAPFRVHIQANTGRLWCHRNFWHAASLCSGDIFAFCDQDDVWLPEKLALCVAEFEADPDVVLVCHNRAKLWMNS